MYKTITLILFLIFAVNAFADLPPTQTKGSGDTAYSTTFKFDFPYFPITKNGVTASFGALSISGGGTGQAITPTPGGIAYGTASGISLTAAQTSGQVIISQGSSAPIGFNPTAGAVLFAGTSGAISQSANTFSWDQNNTRLTVGGGSNTVTVGGAAKNSVLSLSGTRASNEYELGIHKHSATLNPGMYLLRSRGSESAPTIVSNGDLLGVMDGLGFDGTDFEIGAQIDYVVDGTPGSNDMPGAILFKTTPDGSATPATAATISNDKTLTLYGALDTALTTSGVVLTGSSGIITSRSQLQLVNGGTNTNIVASQGGIAYGTASGISLTVAGSSGQFLKSNGTGVPNFAAITLSGDVSGILPLANGGTNANITASHGGMAYSTASAISLTAVGISGQMMISQGAAAPIWVTRYATQGTRQTGTSISAATAITATVNVDNTIFVVGNGGPVVVTATTPFVTTNMTVGQEMSVCGTSNTNTVTYNNGNNLVLTGTATLGKDMCIKLFYAGSDGTNAAWIENWRNF